ncbi:MAG: 5'/3'-nucleotidase SurE [Snowella sp.]|nr:5'/3'-nucleotidase SurE [Snowella sp.]
MTLILTNDDGIDAPGILALRHAVQDKAVIVAPKDHYSGCGHQITAHQPIHVEKRSDTEFAVGGTPADCTRLGVTHLYPEAEWVLSGINAGGNLGVDAYISGTVAAVREAAILGFKGIAISHWIKRPLVIDWAIASAWTAQVLEQLWSLPLPPKHFWNVNLPHLEPGSPLPEMVFCEASNDPLPVAYQLDGEFYCYHGEYAKRDRTAGTDVDICFSGKIAITQLRV